MNRLRESTSPYLRQHADNPVDWYPWGPEALAVARREDKPIFLSVGYSACHWCHVMAHESFEDPAVARRLREDFIAIKVDREERPDLDHIYQGAHRLLTRQGGGWPLSVFLTPQLKPFFSGTYFPNPGRRGLPSFMGVLDRVARVFHERRGEVDEHAEQVVRHLTALQRLAADADGGADAPDLAAYGEGLLANHDPVHGGFGQAPKFPHVTDLRLLLRLAWRSGQRRHAEPVAFTLDRMIAGGLMDQVGGGFARYSVDDRWLVPHFEKMLYDNGQMLLLLAEADALLGVDPERRRARRGIVAWVERRMRLDHGAFASALDADSAGEEGRYYLWTPKELAALLTGDDLALALGAWGVTPGGNFEGRSILHRAMAPEELIATFGPEAPARLARSADLLLSARRTRVPPARDDKVLLGWNALMIRGLLRHAALENDDHSRRLALTALDFLTREMRTADGWHAVWGGGCSHTPAFLDDH
nr:thioredoxin domain-containing protein [Magnetococcales bacterium]